MQIVSLNKVRIDCGTQIRTEIDQLMVDDYAEKMQAGDEFPPVTLFNDGVHFYLADGFHRYFAFKKLGRHGLEAEVRSGTLSEAILFALKANSKHGKPRTIADKTNAVMICLKHVEWSMFPTAKIAEMCDVSIPFVAKLRRGEEPDKIKYVDKDGEIIERKNPSKKVKEEKVKPKEEKLLKEEPTPTVGAHELEQANEAIDSLSKANQELEDKLAAQLSPDPAWAENYIAELREQINLLEIELDGVKKSRNSYQTENAELMKQVRYLEKKVKKLEGK